MTSGKQGFQDGPLSSSKSQMGLALLVQAYEYAQEVDRDAWDFAVEVPALQKVEFSLSEIRWLVCKCYAQHARETTSPGDSSRSFRHESHLALRKRSCVVLTELGVAFARQFTGTRTRAAGSCRVPAMDANRGAISAPVTGRLDSPNGDRKTALIPCWDCVRQELRFGREVIKEYKLHCPNQAIILASFEEEHWPPRIDDPLPRREDIEPKQRLHDTIKSLNRNQKCQLIRFRGDGTGQGVRWELAAIAAQRLSPSR